MKGITEHLYGWPSTVLHFLIIPVFYFFNILFYGPFDTIQVLEMGRGLLVFNLTILSSILFGVEVSLRILFRMLRKVMNLNYVLYALWCIGEILVFSAFTALYLTLMSHHGLDFFYTMLRWSGYNTIILVFPFVILAQSFAIHGLVKSESGPVAEQNVIKFKDDKQQLKIALPASSIMYIEASENYVIIGYSDKSGLKKYTLRSSMKKVETIVAPYGIVRCQRTWFVNPVHVRLISRSSEGYIFAELDCEEAPRIPISRTYYDKLSSML